MSLPRKSSLVDYSKIVDRPVQDERFESRAPQPKGGPAAAKAAAVPAVKMSAQMDAVVRLMTGQSERTLADKLADANRPTWEEYKKDNHDKLNLDEGGRKEMEEYRRELDAQRDRLLAKRGTGSSSKNNTKRKKSKKKKKRKRHDESSSEDGSDDDSEDDDSESTSSSERGERKRRKKHKKKHKKRKKRRKDDDDSCTSSESDRKRRRKKHHKRKKRQSDEESDGSHYKLSKFFTEGAENDT
jgi:hypothetical protein